jgi:hypothetical protein
MLLQNTDAFYIAQMQRITHAVYQNQLQSTVISNQATARQLFSKYAKQINTANQNYIKHTHCSIARNFPLSYLDSVTTFYLEHMPITQKIRHAAIQSAGEFTAQTKPVKLTTNERQLFGQIPPSAINQWQAINIRNLNKILSPQEKSSYIQFQNERNKLCNYACQTQASDRIQKSIPTKLKKALGAQYAAIVGEYTAKLRALTHPNKPLTS